MKWEKNEQKRHRDILLFSIKNKVFSVKSNTYINITPVSHLLISFSIVTSSGISFGR